MDDDDDDGEDEEEDVAAGEHEDDDYRLYTNDIHRGIEFSSEITSSFMQMP